MKNNFTREEMKSRLSELWDELSKVSGGELWGKISPESWKLARKLFDLEIGDFMSKKSDKKAIEEFREQFHIGHGRKWILTEDESEEIESFLLKTRRKAVEEAFKDIEIKRLGDYCEKECSCEGKKQIHWRYGNGYNHAIDEIEQKKKERLDKLKDNQN